jgi:hypothetical protein
MKKYKFQNRSQKKFHSCVPFITLIFSLITYVTLIYVGPKHVEDQAGVRDPADNEGDAG